jgi:hypothetical protein
MTADCQHYCRGGYVSRNCALGQEATERSSAVEQKGECVEIIKGESYRGGGQIMKETIQILRNILFRTFLISLVFALLMASVYYGRRDYWDSLIVNRWGLIDQPSLNVVAVSFFSLIRFYLVFLLLSPTLALHWTFKCLDR